MKTWVQTNSDFYKGYALVDEEWTLETDSLRIVIQRLRSRTKRDEVHPNWILRCFGVVFINHHDLATPSLEQAKVKAVQYLKLTLEHLSLELADRK